MPYGKTRKNTQLVEWLTVVRGHLALTNITCSTRRAEEKSFSRTCTDEIRLATFWET